MKTRQTVRTTVADPALPTASNPSGKAVVEKKLNVIQTILHILRTDGFSAFFHGLGPALVLVSNPILQFTVSKFTACNYTYAYARSSNSCLNSSRTSSWLAEASD